MHTSTVLATLLGACSVFAAPAWPEITRGSELFDSKTAVSSYFEALAQELAKGAPQAPSCDLSKAVLPSSALPGPDSGLVLKHVAIGRGTQNYTCDLSNATAVPVQTGALATLFNASCVASMYPQVLAQIPRAALAFDVDTADNGAPANTQTKFGVAGDMAVSGKHFFLTTTTPFFNMDTTNGNIGEAPCSKINSTAAPADAPTGQNGEAAVPWLKLHTNAGATGNLENVFRVNTAGGSAPATCTGQAASFEIQYAAEYWFYES